MLRETTPSEAPDLWSRIWPSVLILIVATVAWALLSHLAFEARRNPARWPSIEDGSAATAWAKDILGLAVALAGFLGIAAAAGNSSRDLAERAQRMEGGMVGVLGGATLLDVGGWPVPLGLLAVATGAVVGRVILWRRASKAG